MSDSIKSFMYFWKYSGVEGHSCRGKAQAAGFRESQFSRWKTCSNNWKKNEWPVRWQARSPPWTSCNGNLQVDRGGSCTWWVRSDTDFSGPFSWGLRKWLSFDFTLKSDFKGWYLISVGQKTELPIHEWWSHLLLCREPRKSSVNWRQFLCLGWAQKEGLWGEKDLCRAFMFFGSLV